MSVVVRQSQKAQLACAAAQRCQNHAYHLDGHRLVRRRQCHEEHAQRGHDDEADDADPVRNFVYKVWGDQLREKGRHNVGKEDDALWDAGTDEILCGRQDDDVEDIVDEAYSGDSLECPHSQISGKFMHTKKPERDNNGRVCMSNYTL